MSLRRVRVDTVVEGENTLNADQERYLVRVLRLRTGTEVELFDGQGRRGRGQLGGSEGAFWVHIDAIEADPAPPFALTLAVAPPKGDRADWLVEKVTELGAFELQWLHSARSVVQLKEGSNKLERFRRIADSAARQSGQSWTLTVRDPIPFSLFLERPLDRKWVAHPGGSPLEDVPARGTGAVLIGPEGGFTDEEVSSAENAGYSAVSLGPTVLRVETAAIAATVLARAAAMRG